MKEWVPRAARIGYAAKGVTYVLIAILALQSAIEGNTRPENTRGALHSIDGPPGGKLLLLLISVGLFAYAFWKIYLTLVAPQNDDWNKRTTALVVAFTNAGFGLEALRLSLSLGTRSGSRDQAQHWSAVLMSHSAGAIGVGLCGVFIIGYGVSQIVRAMRRKVDDHLRALRLPGDAKRWVINSCRFGIAARGVVFGLVGWFLVRAALDYDPGQARDFGNSLAQLRQQPMGRTLLCVVAIGLLGYAFYQFLRARYEHFSA